MAKVKKQSKYHEVRTWQFISDRFDGRIGITLPFSTSYEEFKTFIPAIIRELTYLIEKKYE